MTGESLDRFDAGAPVAVEELLGRWRGSTWPTGHPLDGLLERYGWYGKEFVSADIVHPLLFTDGAGRPRPLDSRLVPFLLMRRAALLGRLPGARLGFAAVRPLLWTRRPGARLRLVEHRGTTTAAMIYDALPVIDVFRRLDDDTLLGLMDMRGMAQPFFFTLQREG